MTIFSMNEGEVPAGEFMPEATVIGATRAECLTALQGQCCFYKDVGASTRSDRYLDAYGEVCIKEIGLYTLVGGSVR